MRKEEGRKSGFRHFEVYAGEGREAVGSWRVRTSFAAVKPISTGMPSAFLDWRPGRVILKRWAGARFSSETLVGDLRPVTDFLGWTLREDVPVAVFVLLGAMRSRRPPRTAWTLRGVGGSLLEASKRNAAHLAF